MSSLSDHRVGTSPLHLLQYTPEAGLWRPSESEILAHTSFIKKARSKSVKTTPAGSCYQNVLFVSRSRLPSVRERYPLFSEKAWAFRAVLPDGLVGPLVKFHNPALLPRYRSSLSSGATEFRPLHWAWSRRGTNKPHCTKISPRTMSNLLHWPICMSWKQNALESPTSSVHGVSTTYESSVLISGSAQKSEIVGMKSWMTAILQKTLL